MTKLVDGQSYSNLAALIVVLYECLATMPHEYALIKSLRINQSKLTYIANRLFSAAFQLATFTCFLRFRMKASTSPLPHYTCKRWFAMQSIALYLIYIIGYVYNMRGAYFLHRCSRKILLLLSLITVLELVTTLVFAPKLLNELVFDGYCNIVSAPRHVFIIILAPIFFTQLIMWHITYAKGPTYYNKVLASSPCKWIRLTTYGLLLAMMPSLSFKAHLLRVDLIFAWPMTILSISNSRMVMRSERMKKATGLSLGDQGPGSRPMSTASMSSPAQDRISYDSGISLVAVRSHIGYITDAVVIGEALQPSTEPRTGLTPSATPPDNEDASQHVKEQDQAQTPNRGSFVEDEESVDDYVDPGTMRTSISSSSGSEDERDIYWKRAWARSSSMISA